MLEDLKKAVLEGEDELAVTISRRALDEKIPPPAISEAIMAGIQEAGHLWQDNVYFQPDVVMSAEAFRSAMDIVGPYLTEGQSGAAGKVVIGTVAGDMHDLGKMMVIAMLRANDFEVIDLGEDVPLEVFINKVEDLKPDILGLGCYMTTTMLEMNTILKKLRKKGLRDDVKIMIGGVCTSQKFADEIGADAWGKDAIDAVEKARSLMELA